MSVDGASTCGMVAGFVIVISCFESYLPSFYTAACWAGLLSSVFILCLSHSAYNIQTINMLLDTAVCLYYSIFKHR